MVEFLFHLWQTFSYLSASLFLGIGMYLLMWISPFDDLIFYNQKHFDALLKHWNFGNGTEDMLGETQKLEKRRLETEALKSLASVRRSNMIVIVVFTVIAFSYLMMHWPPK